MEEEFDEFGIPIKSNGDTAVQSQSQQPEMDEFGIPIKKKEKSETTSSSIAPNQKLDSPGATESTSSDTQALNDSLYKDYESSYQITPDQELEIEQKLQEQKQPGLWDKFRASQGSRLLGLQPKEFTPGNKSKEDLEKEYIEKNKEEYFENLSKDQLTELQKQEYSKIESLNNKNKARVIENDSLNEQRELIFKEAENLSNSIAWARQNGKEPTEQAFSKLDELIAKNSDLESKMEKNIKEYESSFEDLQDFEKELELFKKNWSTWSSAKETAKLGGARIMNGLANTFSDITIENPYFAGNVLGLNDVNNAIKEGTEIFTSGKFIDEVNKQESRLKPKTDVSGISSPEDFGEFFVESLAEQAPILATVATGYGGIAALGVSEFGNKKQELEGEVKSGDANYSNSQILVSSAISAGLETVGGLVDRFALGQGARALRAGIKGGSEAAIKKGAAKYLNPILAEEGEEIGALVGNQLIDKFYLKKKNVEIGDDFLNTIAKTGITVGFINTVPTLVGDALSSYTSYSKKQAIRKNIETVNTLRAQLENNPDFTEVERTAINSKINSIAEANKKIMDDTISIVKKLSPEEKKQIAKIEDDIAEQKKSISEISKSENMTPEAKEVLIDDFKNEIEENEKSKESILDAKKETPTQETTQQEVEGTTPENQTEPEQVADEAAQTENPTPDGNVEPGTDTNIQQGENNEVQTAVEPTTSQAETKPIIKKVKAKAFGNNTAEYDVEFTEDGIIKSIKSPKDGREISKWKYDKETGKPTGLNGNYTKIEAAALGTKTENEIKAERQEKLNTSLENFEATDLYDKALEYLAKGGMINTESASKETGFSKQEVKWLAKDSKIRPNKDLKTLEEVAESLDPENSQDARNALISAIGDVKNREAAQDKIIQRYDEKSEELRQQEFDAYANALSEEEFSKFEFNQAEEEFLSELSYDEKITYFEDQYGTEEGQIEQADGNTEGKNPSVQERTGQTKEQRKQTANEKIDAAAAWLKSQLPKAGDGNTQANGFTQDQLIDLTAKLVKQLVSTGIDIDTAIKQVAKDLKERFDVDIDTKTVKEKVNPEPKEKSAEPEKEASFERKPKKKSLLNRVVSGGNSQQIKEAVEKYGLNYEIENQKLARENVVKFIKEVGVDKALKAARGENIKGAEKAFIYAEALDAISLEIEKAKQSEVEGLEAKYTSLLAEITNEFDKESREAGRFISALNNVYNSSILKYNLTKQVDDYKAKNGGVIEDDVMEKFVAANKKIKELEAKIEKARIALEKAEDQQNLENITEAAEREAKQQQNKRAQAKNLANRIRKAKIHRPGIFSSATPASLAWDGAVEIVAKSVEAGGSLADAINKGMAFIKKSNWYKGLNNSDKKEAETAFKNTMNNNEVEAYINISDDGKISVPASVVRDFVEQGITDIDVISQKILDEMIEDFPDLTVREIRDAISGYGKKINLSKDEIDVEIRKLKRVGKIISSEEDVSEGKRPRRSGVQRDKISQEERKRLRAIKEAMRDIPMDESELDNAWKNALDTVKSRLKNQIEDLNDQIKKGEKSKPQRNPIEYDQEAKDLKERRDELRTTLESIVGKTELTTEQKIKRAEKGLESSIEKLQKDISEGNLEYKSKPEPLKSKRLEALRKQREALSEQLNELREQNGIIEKRRMELRKNAINRRISELQEMIKNKDFAKKEKKKPVEDAELRRLLTEKEQYQEVFNKEQYKLELKNRSLGRKIRDVMVMVWGVPRILLATAEMSFVFIQGATQTARLAVTRPVTLFKVFKETFKAMSSESKAKKFESRMRSNDTFRLMKEHKLSITSTDYKMEAKEETFQGDLITAIIDLVGNFIDNKTNQKELTTIGDKILSLIGRDVSGKQKVPLGTQIKNINPIKAIERGNTVYMNQIRMIRYMDGLKMLSMEGKNPIDNEQDYKKMASAINSLTGRADIGRLENISDILNAIFFSFKNTVSTFNQLNPYWYWSMRSTDNKWNKPSAAQKIAIKDMISFIGLTGSFMFFTQIAGGKDDDDEWNYKIELDPTSSDFLKLKQGNIRFDPWHGMSQLVVFYARLLTNESKSVKGKKKQLGEGYRAENRQDLVVRMASNKFSPSTSLLWRKLGTYENKKGVTVDAYGNEFDLTEELTSLKPIYFDGLMEIAEEDPDAYTMFLTALGFFGFNSMVYGDEEKKNKKGMIKEKQY